MSKIFHVTLTQGRADTFYIEANTKSDVLTFLSSVSTAVISNIKEVVFSKEYDINYIPQTIENNTSHKSVKAIALSKTYSKIFEFFNIKDSVTNQDIIKQLKQLMILNEPIIDIASITFYK
ncbi:hypothetical protein Arnit_1703 [Arcobacter nitrofigilis DSM 7299]|uniref:Uncharacterized protein n=1 Tax=Arcobacter nitrofigilis (strain ATCC 33309 / DSM 7299 / CCUG 15893 / LMG 7604 / NCTC 12251 / CI) TaxID=572480 RepID=D5UZY8_ARCNC|nr:hypothetical protein [Arcobacter nitrofigilis]ADG93357.1 hypothetical protein Arnit_1703 [Arcobacter nitrofigilis DSM 7299]